MTHVIILEIGREVGITLHDEDKAMIGPLVGLVDLNIFAKKCRGIL